MQGHLALLKRLGNTHENESFIREEIRKKEAGERGEDRLLVKLGELRLLGTFRIISDVALHEGDWKVQIDCLVVTDRCCIVLESKNMSGDLNFDTSTEEFYRLEGNNLETPFPNPYFQLMRNIRFMKDLLRRSFPELQVTGAIVMTSKSCRIRNKPSHYPVFKLESIIEKIIHMYNHSSPDFLSDKQLATLEHMIRGEQSKFTYPPLCEHYRISPNDLIRGVECPHCGVLGMKRLSTTWTCLACKKNHRYAHISAVNDYFLLIKKEITNKEIRRFCGIESIYSASRMLNKMNLEAHGSGPGRYFTQKSDK
ncbi:nuclease-related domain-containing protein [Psychrobacillus sp. FSL H8-0483]|uniref:nuclease-related domain-containing protein n=1 Tax=Psychrobacillus sp. FSL H8-0483 TaxID=2921389 RepID=UPI00315A06FE